MSKTIQLWPAGRSITFAGEYPHYTVRQDDGLMRAATPGENREIQIQELAERYSVHEILCSDSALVEELIGKDFDGFGIDDLQGVYVDASDWALEQCRDYLRDNGAGIPDPDPWSMDRDELVDTGYAGIGIDTREEYGHITDDEARQSVIDAIDSEEIDGLEEWRNTANEYSQENPQEAYQWFRVTPWLRAELAAIGEITIDNSYGDWWGRGCCGQSVLMDGTLQKIAANVLDR